MVKKCTSLIAVLITLFFISAAVLVKISEKEASKNILINVSKRMAAEGGAFFVNYIYDPGFDGEGYVHFGPEHTEASRFYNWQEGNGTLSFLKNALNAHIVEYINNVPSPYAASFDYQPFNSEKLMTLREKYRLKEMTDGFRTELEKILFLRNWVKNRWEHGVPKNISYNFDALDILSRAEKGEKFFCSEYSTTFVQCILSIGLQARYVGLFKGHVVAEVWSNELAKWVVMDVDNNLHYVRNKIPLNTLELHDLSGQGKWDEVQVMVGHERKVADEKRKEDLLSFYHEFYIRMRNDWFSKKYPHWHPKANSIMNGLEWKDKYTSNNILVARETENKEELYFPLNVTGLNILKKKSTRNQIFLTLNTFTPNFSYFVIRIDCNEWVKQDISVVVWNIHKGHNRLETQAVNSLGVRGPSSLIDLVVN